MWKFYKTLVVCILLGCNLIAQNKAYYQGDINNALSKGDCQKAKQWYIAFKELFGVDSDFEYRISLCISSQKNNIVEDVQKFNVSNFSETINGATFEMIIVKGGSFNMGCMSDKDTECVDWEKPAHKVTIGDFYIGKYEVKQSQWHAIMGNYPSYFKGDNLPVESVSWYDVEKFINQLNTLTNKHYRLPTEAEWEYAARGGIKSNKFVYSGSNSIDIVAWYEVNSNHQTHSVGVKSPNELGIYDLSGNVLEWCNDISDTYNANNQTNPIGGANGERRIIRGGCWLYKSTNSRVSLRDDRFPEFKSNYIGLRLVLIP